MQGSRKAEAIEISDDDKKCVSYAFLSTRSTHLVLLQAYYQEKDRVSGSVMIPRIPINLLRDWLALQRK